MKFSLVTCRDQFLADNSLLHHCSSKDKERQDDTCEDEFMIQNPLELCSVPVCEFFQLPFKPKQEAAKKIGRPQIFRFANARCHPWRKRKTYQQAGQCGSDYNNRKLF